MKKTSRLFCAVLAIVLVLATAVPAFAAGTGKIIINNAIKDNAYSIYKMLDFSPTAANADTGIYTIVTGWEEFFNGTTAKNYFNVEGNNVTKKAETVDADLAKAAIEYAKSKNISATKTTVADVNTVEFSALDFGYYAIDTTVGTICSLTNTSDVAKAYEKNSAPALEKKIVEGTDLVDANNAAIGDTVTYQAKITVGPGAENYVMHDKMSEGLTFDKIISVKVNNADLTVTQDYTVNISTAENKLADECDFEITFTNAYLDTVTATKEIIVTYTAKLNDQAVIGNTGNPNTAWLEYGVAVDTNNNGSIDEDEKKPTTPEDNVITYTAMFTVDKIDEQGNALKGAGFTLYKGDKAISENAIGEEIKGEDLTSFVWEGLAEGTYTLKETTTPAGYNTVKDITFTITCKEPETVLTVNDEAEWTRDGSTVDAFKIKVTNTTGMLLPETGGVGTTIFYIVGALLVLGAVILLITKRRASVEA